MVVSVFMSTWGVEAVRTAGLGASGDFDVWIH